MPAKFVSGIFAQIGLGLPILISWRETPALAEMCAKRYRRQYSAVFVYRIWMVRAEKLTGTATNDHTDLPSGPNSENDGAES